LQAAGTGDTLVAFFLTFKGISIDSLATDPFAAAATVATDTVTTDTVATDTVATDTVVTETATDTVAADSSTTTGRKLLATLRQSIVDAVIESLAAESGVQTYNVRVGNPVAFGPSGVRFDVVMLFLAANTPPTPAFLQKVQKDPANIGGMGDKLLTVGVTSLSTGGFSETASPPPNPKPPNRFLPPPGEPPPPPYPPLAKAPELSPAPPPPPPIPTLNPNPPPPPPYSPPPPPDRVPPTLSIFGPLEVKMPQTWGDAFTTYSDAGAACTDIVDGVITPERAITLDGSPVESITSQVFTADDSPYLIKYDCRDSLGNAAPTQTRKIIVEALCPAPSSICGDGTCADTSTGTSICGTGLVEEAEVVAIVEAFTVKENTNPPTITLLPLRKDCKKEEGCELSVLTGAAGTEDAGKITFVIIQYLPQEFGKTYVDPGVSAMDAEDGELSSVAAEGVGGVDLSKPTGTRPYVIKYNVKDNGKPQLAAKEVRRRVYVTNPCAEKDGGDYKLGKEILCEDSGECSSFGGSCVALPKEEEVAKVVAPPVVTLKGSTVFEIAQYSGFVKCPEGQDVPVSAVCDRGATAYDEVDGDLTGSLMACGQSYAEKGIQACKVLTDTEGTYVITFTVTNSQTPPLVNAVPVTRTITVLKACKPPTVLCNDQESCSDEAGICKADILAGGIDTEEKEVDEPPVMTLRTDAFLKKQVTVRRFQPYEWCIGDQVPSEKVPCELGVVVMDKEEGNLTEHALICPPVACLSVGCPDHKKLNPADGSLNKPLQPYCINTAAAVGSQIDITFVVFEQATFPPKNVTVIRTIVIINPCDDGNFQCLDDGDYKCSNIECEQRKRLNDDVVAADKTPPVINTLVLQTPSGQLLPIPAILEIPYQEKHPTMKYTMCAKCGDSNCGVCAVDQTDGDVSSSLRVVQIKANDADLSCPIAAVTEGQCATGRYVYEYAAADNTGNEATARLEVRIVSTGEVITSYPMGIYTDPNGIANAMADGLLYFTPGSLQNLVFRKSVATVMSAGGSGALTEDEVEVIGYSTKRKTARRPTYAVVVQVKIKVVTGRAAAAAPESGGTRRRAQRRRRVLLARSTDDDPHSLDEEREAGWSSAGDFSSEFLGHWRQRSLLQAAASASELDSSLSAVSDALAASKADLNAALSASAAEAGLPEIKVDDPDKPKTEATTPVIDIEVGGCTS
jgi:hypothetical protein